MTVKRLPLTAFILLVLSVYPLPYYVIVSDVRYRYPILWLSMLGAGFFADELFRALRRKMKGRTGSFGGQSSRTRQNAPRITHKCTLLRLGEISNLTQ